MISLERQEGLGEKEETFLIFHLGKENFLIGIDKVLEILMMPEITPIPETPYFIEGIIDLRDEIVPIINLQKIFNISSKRRQDKDIKAIIIRVQKEKIALMVDDVSRIETLPLTIFDTSPSIVTTDVDFEFIDKIGVVDENTYLLLNMSQVVPLHKTGFIEIKPEEKPTMLVAETGLDSADVKDVEVTGKRTVSPIVKGVEKSLLVEPPVAKLSEAQIDALKEAANIGSGNAVTALAQMIDKKVTITVPRALLMPLEEIPKSMGGSEKNVVGIFSHLKGVAFATILMLFPTESVVKLLEEVMDTKPEKETIDALDELSEMEKSAITEIGNILDGHYTRALCDLMELRLEPEPPDLAFDKIGNLVNFLATDQEDSAKYSVAIETKMFIGSTEITGTFFFLPSVETLHIFLNALEYAKEKVITPAKKEEKRLEEKPKKEVVKVEEKKEKKKIKLNETQLDALREVGNIGAGNAVNALSQLIGKRVEVLVPNVDISPIESIPKHMGGKKKQVAGIFTHMTGDAPATMLVLFPVESIMKIVRFLMEGEKEPKEIKKIRDLSEMERSVIVETGNILSGHYATALTDLMGIRFIHQTPDITFDDVETIINFLSKELGELADHAVVIQTKLVVYRTEITGSFFFIPNEERLEKILKALGVA